MSAPIHPEVFDAEKLASVAVTRGQAVWLGQIATEAEQLHRDAIRLALEADELAVELDADLSCDFADLLDASDAVASALIRFADLVGHGMSARDGAAAVHVPIDQHRDVELPILPLGIDPAMVTRAAAAVRDEVARKRKRQGQPRDGGSS